mmetsp:Transcript_39459/g.100011  ORF Transcript_39459/g.100011 Transcript_39459/m.100011 type:complete len:315 (-) Transcript_39459:909-1853(-)
MHNVLHRRPLVRHRAHERCQPARLVRDDHGEVHQAPVRRQAALNDTAQRGDVDVAAREDDRNALPLQLRQVPGHQRTDGSRASAFGHHLLLLDEPQHAQADVFLADGDDFVHILARQGKRVRPHLEHRQAISKGAPIGVDANGRTVVQGSGEGGHARRLHPDDLHLGPGRARGVGTSAGCAEGPEGRGPSATESAGPSGAARGRARLTALMASAMPAMRPPPPTGMTTASSSSTCSRISMPTVPAPAKMGGSSYPLMYVSESASRSSHALANASVKFLPDSTTLAPSASQRLILVSGAVSGMTTVTGIFRLRPW